MDNKGEVGTGLMLIFTIVLWGVCGTFKDKLHKQEIENLQQQIVNNVRLTPWKFPSGELVYDTVITDDMGFKSGTVENSD